LLIEFQMEASSPARAIRFRLEDARRPIRDSIANPAGGHNPFYVDHWTLGDTTFAMTKDVNDYLPLAGKLGTRLPILQCTQKIHLFLTGLEALKEKNQHPIPTLGFIPDEVTIVFDLIADLDHDGNPGLNVTLRSVTSALAGVQTGFEFQERIPFDLSNLPKVNQNDPTPPVLNLGAAVSLAGDLLALRIEVNEQASDAESAWQSFMDGDLTNRLLGDRWSIFMDKRLLTSPLEKTLASQLADDDGYRDSGEFWLEGGPHVRWSPLGDAPRVIATFNGELVDGCAAIFGPVDMNIDATIDVRITLPKANQIHVEATLSVSLDAWEQFWCSFSEAVDPIGSALQSSNASNAKYFFGAIGISILLGPVWMFDFMTILFSNPLKLAGDKIPDIPGFKKVDDDRWVMDTELHPPDAAIVTNMRVTKVTAQADGLVFSGSFDHVSEMADPVLRIEPWADHEFTWQNDHPCVESIPLLKVKVPFAGTTGRLLVAPPEFFSHNAAYEVLVDQWDEQGITLELWVRDGGGSGSAVEVLLLTTGGARYLTIGVPSRLTPFASDADATGYAENLLAVRATNCYLATSIWGKLGVFNPHWTVDPGPEGVGERIWTVVVNGLTPETAVTIHDSAGAVLAQSLHEQSSRTLQFDVATRGAATSGMQARAATAGPELTIARGGTSLSYKEYLEKARALLAEAPMKGPSNLSVRQTLLVPAGSTAHAPVVVALAGQWQGDAAVFAVATAEGLSAHRVAAEGTTKAGDLTMKGLRGVIASRRGFVVWGDSGAFLWHPTGGDRRVLADAPVMGAAAFGSWISLLTSDGLATFAPEGSAPARMRFEGGVTLARTRRFLLLAAVDRILALDARRPMSPERWGWYGGGAGELLRVRGIGASTRVVAVGEQSSTLLDFARPGPAEAIQEYRRLGWIARAARAGAFAGRIEPDGRTVTFFRRAGTAVTRDALCR